MINFTTLTVGTSESKAYPQLRVPLVEGPYGKRTWSEVQGAKYSTRTTTHFWNRFSPAFPAFKYAHTREC